VAVTGIAPKESALHPFANHAVSGGPLPTVLASKLAPPVAPPATIGRPHLVARMARTARPA